jgi:Baseplate J-like protein
VKGKRVAEARASGRVTFRSYNTGAENTIPTGSIVSTEGGLQFRTQSAARLAKAQIVPGTPVAVVPSKATVDVVAVRPGTGGNVPTNAITVVPRSEDPVLTRVANGDPTAGGRHDEIPRIDQSDIDAALGQLKTHLEEAFTSTLAEPGRVPTGLTAFRDTRLLSPGVPSVDPATLLGKEVDAFDLRMTSTGSVIAVDQSLVTALATDRIRAAVSEDHAIVDGSLHADVGQPSVDGESVVFPVTAQAVQVAVIDAPRLVGIIKGKPIPQARAALQPYGDVQVTVWPDWVSSIPTIDGRIDLEVASPAPPAP